MNRSRRTQHAALFEKETFEPIAGRKAQQEVYIRLGIDWRRAFEPVKTEVKG